MKFSYNWLREMVPALDASPHELERMITIKTAECEGVEEAGSDYVIEVDNKSLTHRPDLWGHHGMAREVAAIVDSPLADPVKNVPEFHKHQPAIQVTIDDYGLCPRYSALVFDHVKVQPSPQWLVERLKAVGLNAINNIVDVTNFVMAEIAQPMHAFDAAKLHGSIRVRSAEADESFAALNGESYVLDPSNLVIADDAGAIALAGVIGGAASAVSESTTKIVLESANFNASSVRKTSARLRLRTDASMRFEKAQDPLNTIRGLERAYALLKDVSPGIRLVGGVADAYHPQPSPHPITLPLDWLEAKLGRAPLPPDEVRQILQSLEFGVKEEGPRVFSVTVPSWRATKDISIKEDLVEEIGRMIGYASITPTAPLSPAKVPASNPEREFQHHMREMAAAQGFTEVYNYSFLSDEMVRTFAFDPESHVQVANPIASDQNLLRTSLLPGILKNVRDNARHFDHFRLFEIGKEIHFDAEVPHLVGAIYSKDNGLPALLELKRLAACLAPGCDFHPDGDWRRFEHPYRAANVLRGDRVIGRLFEFHPRMLDAGRAAILDLDLAIVEETKPGQNRYTPLRRFPTSAFDISVVAGPRTLIGDVQARLREHAGQALVSIQFLHDFALPDGKRSLSYRLTLGSLERTLTSEEVMGVRAKVIDGIQADGFELRV